jgi:SAM-dependent methyltransferase
MTDGPPRIFDRHALALRRARARRIGGDAFLALEAADGLAARLAAVNRRFEEAICLDTLDPAFDILEAAAQHWDFATLGEREAMPLPSEAYDLVVSVLSLHAVNDLPGVLKQIRGKLKPDGLFVAAMFGAETLRELRDSFAAAEIETTGGVSPRVAPFADVRDLGGLLQRAGFALPVADVERTTVLYRDFTTLVRDLRAHGETNALTERLRKPLSRATQEAMLAHYHAHHAEPDGRLRATFDIVYLTGWAPHESQQKPLKPGSATTRLAEALGTSEQPAGEIATPHKK